MKFHRQHIQKSVPTSPSAQPAGPDSDDTIDAFSLASALVSPAAVEGTADILYRQYIGTNDIGTLNYAINFYRVSLDKTDPDDSARVRREQKLTDSLKQRFYVLRNAGDIDEAVTLCEECLSRATLMSSERTECLINMAGALGARYEAGRQDERDLERAIAALEEAASLAGDDSSLHSPISNNLAHALTLRYALSKSNDDLNRALSAAEAAVAKSIPGSPHRGARLTSLAAVLRTKFLATGDIMQLDRGISTCEAAAAEYRVPSPELAGALRLLAECLSLRYQQLGAEQDARRATALLEQVISMTPSESPDLVGDRDQLSRLRRARLKWKLDDHGDLNGERIPP